MKLEFTQQTILLELNAGHEVVLASLQQGVLGVNFKADIQVTRVQIIAQREALTIKN